MNRKKYLYETDLAEAVWRKASASEGAENCVEITDLPEGGVAIRDSKNPHFAHLCYTAEEWEIFRRGVLSGEM